MPTATRSAPISFGGPHEPPGGILVERSDRPSVHAVSGEETLPVFQDALLLVHEERIRGAEGDRSDGSESHFVLAAREGCGELESPPRAVGPVVSDQDSPVRPTLHSFGGDGTMTSGQRA